MTAGEKKTSDVGTTAPEQAVAPGDDPERDAELEPSSPDFDEEAFLSKVHRR